MPDAREEGREDQVATTDTDEGTQTADNNFYPVEHHTFSSIQDFMMALYEPVGVSQISRLPPELLHAINENIYESVSNLLC